MDELELLKAKFEDVVVRSEKLGCACTRFLSPKEQFCLQNYVRLCHPDLVCRLDGGYPDAERKLMFVFADWFDDLCISKEDYYQLLCIKGSGYSKLSHKDYMGALLGLGLHRDTIGDIYVDGNLAFVFVLPSAFEFLMSDFSPLTSVGRDKVKITKASLNDSIYFKRNFDVSTVSVASLRLDAIVAAITPLSREKGCTAIELGLVTHNYEVATKGSVQVNDDDIISVKGYGKFVINLTDQVSKKGKIKIKAMKYI